MQIFCFARWLGNLDREGEGEAKLANKCIFNIIRTITLFMS